MERQNLAGYGKYKLIALVDDQPDYTAYVAVDIESGARGEVALNLYRGQAAIREMAPLIERLNARVCPEFVGRFSSAGCYAAVFRYHPGLCVQRALGRASGASGETRRLYAEKLFRCALEAATLAPALQRAALELQNLVVATGNGTLQYNYFLRPGGRAPAVGDSLLAAARVVLGPCLDGPEELYALMQALQTGELKRPSEIYLRWRQAAQALDAERSRPPAPLTRLRRLLRRLLRGKRRGKLKRGEP